MVILEARHLQLDRALEGFRLSGVPLVEWDQGRFVPAGFSDDQGIYYFIPRLASVLGLPLDTSINLFFASLIGLGFLLSLFFFWRLFKTPLARIGCAAGMALLAIFSYKVTDVYIAQMLAVCAGVPLWLWLEKEKKFSTGIKLGLIFTGLVVGYCNMIRSQAGTGLLIFALVWLWLRTGFQVRQRVLGSCLLLVFTLAAGLHFRVLETKRDEFLKSKDPTYQHVAVTHPFWHSVYIGFGYLPNDRGIRYDDTNAWDKARSVNPKVASLSKEYSDILRAEVFKLVREAPLFVLQTLLAKGFRMALYILVFANAGWFYCWKSPPSWREALPFAAAAAFYSLPGFLVTPMMAYVFGLISLAAIFGIWRIAKGIE